MKIGSESPDGGPATGAGTGAALELALVQRLELALVQPLELALVQPLEWELGLAKDWGNHLQQK